MGHNGTGMILKIRQNYYYETYYKSRKEKSAILNVMFTLSIQAGADAWCTSQYTQVI